MEINTKKNDSFMNTLRTSSPTKNILRQSTAKKDKDDDYEKYFQETIEDFNADNLLTEIVPETPDTTSPNKFNRLSSSGTIKQEFLLTNENIELNNTKTVRKKNRRTSSDISPQVKIDKIGKSTSQVKHTKNNKSIDIAITNKRVVNSNIKQANKVI